MKLRISVISIVLLSLLSACAPTATPTPEPTVTSPAFALDQPFTLHTGQAITAEGLTVRFDGVIEDSRCPTKVVCAWSGRASVNVMIKRANQPELAYILSTRSSPTPTERLFYLDYTLTLSDVTPRPEEPGSTIPADQYAATFIVTRRPTTTDCPPRPDDAAGYLAKICRYVIDHKVNINPAKPATYAVKRTEERTQDNRAVVWVFLNCCGMGDIAVIDTVTGEVIDFRVGVY